MNTANHIPQDDLALFALQFLPEQEMADALVHLEHCEACREEVARYQGDLATYAMTSEMHSPPALARERLLRRVAKEKKVIPIERPQPATTATSSDEPILAPRRGGMFDVESYEDTGRRRGAGFITWAGWAIAAGVAIVAGLQFHQRELLQSNLNDMSARLNQTTGEAARAQEVLKTLTDQGAMQMTLRIPVPEGVPASHLPEGHAAYLADKGSLVFVASNLLPLPQYKTYELWVMPQTGQDAIPAGIFKPDEKGNANVVMPDVPKGVQAKGFAVTIEDDGGTKQPTMPIVLVGMQDSRV